jgi:hypothetical protein
VTSRLFQGHQVKPVSLFFFNHTGGLDHAGALSGGSIVPNSLIAARQAIGSGLPVPFWLHHGFAAAFVGSGAAADLHWCGEPLESPSSQLNPGH